MPEERRLGGSRQHLLVLQLRSGAAAVAPHTALRAPRALRAPSVPGPGKSREIPRAEGRAGITTLRLRRGVTQDERGRGHPAPLRSNPRHLQPGALRAGGKNPQAPCGFALALCASSRHCPTVPDCRKQAPCRVRPAAAQMHLVRAVHP